MNEIIKIMLAHLLIIAGFVLAFLASACGYPI